MKKLKRKERKEIISFLEEKEMGINEVRVMDKSTDKEPKTKDVEDYDQKEQKENPLPKPEKNDIPPINIDDILPLPDYFIHSGNYDCQGVYQKTKKMLGLFVSCQQDVINYYDNIMVAENLLGKEFQDTFSILEIRKKKDIFGLNEILNKEGLGKTTFIDYLKFHKTCRKDERYKGELKGKRIFSSEEVCNLGAANIQKKCFLLVVKVNGYFTFQPLTSNLGIPIFTFPAGSLILVKKEN